MSKRGEVIAPGKLTRAEWAKRINDAWDGTRGNAVIGFIEIGRDLRAAKDDLDHGEWIAMLEGDLQFDRKVGQSFMRIAKWFDEKAVNDRLLGSLPPDYNTIDKITRFDDATFQRLLDDGTICPTLPRNDVASLLSKINRQKKHRAIAGKAASVVVPENFGPFALLYADPPWRWDHFDQPDQQNEKGLARTPDQHYPTLTYDEIRNFQINGRPIKEIVHKDAALFLWCTSANIFRAGEIMDAWGFEYSTHAVWVKDKAGTGLVFRNRHELLLYGKRGNMPGPQWQPDSVFSYPRGRHSAKPPEVRAAIEKMCPDFNERTRLELFAREQVPGWSVYGFEAFDRAAE